MANYLIPECNLSEFEARVEKLKKRAIRLGLAPIAVSKSIDHVKARVRVLTVDGDMNNRCWELPEEIPARNAKWPCQDTGERMAWWKVEVTGEKPSLNGWSFVAILEPLEAEGEILNLISCLPGQNCPEKYRKLIGHCDHCCTVRKRNQTFVVRHEDGTTKCVGRMCLKDFLGYHADPQELATAAELMAQLGTLCSSAEGEEWLEGGGGSGQVSAWDLNHFLSITACRIRQSGWVSRGKARDDYTERLRATADVVLEILRPPWPGAPASVVAEHARMLAEHTPSDVDEATADAAIEWAKAIPEAERVDYLGNVNLVARAGYVNRKTAGVAASIMVAYSKAMEQEIHRQKMAARPESQHIGEVGKRIPYMQVSCDKLMMREGSYGITGIHKLVDAIGNDLVWFSSQGAVIKEGTTAWIAATVKEHGEFRGRKQTVLTRVAVLTEELVSELKVKEEKKAARAAKKAVKLQQEAKECSQGS